MKSDLTFQLENAAWPAFVVEAGGTIRYANQAAVDFFGPKLEGESLALSALWADSTESAEQFLARWGRSPAATLQLRYHGKGGTIATFDTFICSAREVQKRYIFQLLRQSTVGPTAADQSSDLSKLGAEETKPSSTDTISFQKQRLDCALQLTRSVALDFNNALTGILGHTSLVLARMELDHPWRGSLLEIERAAERAAEITHQLAAFSRAEKDMQEHASGNLNSVMRRVVTSFQKAKPAGIQWQMQLQSHLYSVKFDEAKVQQALLRIVENAVEAVGEVGTITITSRNLEITQPTHDLTAQLTPGLYVCIEITDDGKGIEPEFLPRIFEPFFSTKPGHRGLGLAWVYGIITNHRGGVAISSQARQGTSARIYLPASKKIVAETALFTPDTGGQQTILMVDDEELLLTMGQTVLTSFGYKVITASSGAKALDLIAKAATPIDLVITDLVMPHMSGRELIEQLQLRLPGIPILCTSGFVRPASADENESYLAKPFTSQQLLRSVKHLLLPSDDD
jgi:two-component system cell cycle sensor histidine kinase/response regulator CckA